MNADSRKRGKGAKPSKTKPKKRRVVVGRAAQTPKREVEPFIAACRAPDLEPPVKLTREQLRDLALTELAEHALEAARNLGRSARVKGKRVRGAGQASADAKWLLEQVLNRVAELPAESDADSEQGQSGEGSGSDVTSLVERRRAIQLALQKQREALNK